MKARLLFVTLGLTLFINLCYSQIPLNNSPAPVAPVQDSAMSAAASDLLSDLEPEAGSGSFWKKMLQTLKLGGNPAKEGKKAYQNKEYSSAAQNFSEALLNNPESPEMHYNLGNTQYQQKRYSDAISEFKKALGAQNPSLVANAYYNIGNSHFRLGEHAVQSGDKAGIESYREAMANYKKSLELNPENKDTKRNIEVVQARIKELLQKQENQNQQQQQKQNDQPPPEPSAHAKEIFARAMQLASQRRYADAKQLLETLLQEDPSAQSYQAHVQRLDDVIKINNGETPNSVAPQDPRGTQQGLGVI